MNAKKPGSRPAAKKTPAKTPTKKPAASPARKRNDWEAIERDFRTGKFTLRELEAKHGAGYADISRRAKREGWTKDLADAVRQATTAALIEEITTAGATEAQRSTTDVVLAVAEMNKQVILGHRSDLLRAKDQLAALLVEVSAVKEHEGVLDEAAELLGGNSEDPDAENKLRAALNKAISLPSRAKVVKDIVDSLTKVHDGEVRAYGLAEKPPAQPTGAAVTNNLLALTDEQLAAIATGRG